MVVGFLVDWLNQVPLAPLMLVVTLGYVIGKIEYRGISIGPAGGALGVAIALGMFGLDQRALYGTSHPGLTVGQFGFALFIYSVGFEAGPRFFSSLRGGPGWRFVLVGSLVNVFAVGIALLAGLTFGLGESITAGMLSGALTSAPTYAAAAELLGTATERADLAVSFALTYPVGLVGLVVLLQFLPRLMGDDLAKETESEEDEKRTQGRPELTRAFSVQRSESIGTPLRELDLTHATGCYITMIHRGSEVFVPDAETVLIAGDHVLAKGRFDELAKFEALVGAEVYDEELRQRMPAPRRIIVVSSAVIGKSLTEIDLARKYRCLVIGVTRSGVAIEPTSETVLERGDVLDIVGRRGALKKVATLLGRWQQSTNETDIAVYAAGIFLGLLLGQLRFDSLGVPFTLGTAGGLLLAGIAMGRVRTLGPINTYVPRAARQLVRDLGILLFVAETGLHAGGQSIGDWHGQVVPTLASALGVTLFSVVLAALVGRRILRLRAVDTWGSIGGGMTSSSALVVVRRAAESNQPALSYAAAYAVASVLTTVAGQLVVLLLRM